MKLSDEQERLVDLALKGHNVLVDACIGSGKTTTIQQLCLRLPKNKKLVYLTYNKLLKEDAQSKIKYRLKMYRNSDNFEITNYNGFAYKYLKNMGISVGISEQINRFNIEKPKIIVPDILIVDEYQDIREDHAEMLRYIKSTNPKMQIIMVGDMVQKVYSNTALNVISFVKEFMGEYKEISFTKCFRVNKEWGNVLGEIWGKKINGVNDDCIIKIMNFNEFLSFVKDRETSEILCLGAKTGLMNDALNELEEKYPSKFNKRTVYASIRERDAAITIDKNTAIFTTFDSSKGMERDFCFVFDWTEKYWTSRMSQTGTEYEILRNLFCVAASRGKRGIVFVLDDEQKLLSKAVLKTKVETNYKYTTLLNISEMFEHKFEEDVRECYNLLNIKEKKKRDKSYIDVKVTDEKIDLSPCIGKYQEACFFKNFSMENEYKLFNKTTNNYHLDFSKVKNKSLDEQICTLIAASTRQDRYKTQVQYPIITENEKLKIINRLKKVFNYSETAQKECIVDLQIVKAVGYADVVKNNIVYELKFVSELQPTHFLQCAMYMIALNIRKGIVWNVRTNEIYEIEIKNKRDFLNAVVKTITKRHTQNIF